MLFFASKLLSRNVDDYEVDIVTIRTMDFSIKQWKLLALGYFLHRKYVFTKILTPWTLLLVLPHLKRF